MAAKLTDRSSIPAVVAELTLEEKAHLLTGASSFTTYAVERLGIPSCTVLDGGTGINFQQYWGDVYSRALKRDSGKNNLSLSGISNSTKVMPILDKLESDIPLTDEEQKVADYIRKEMKAIMPYEQQPGCFPPGMLLGATWDPKTVYDCGSAVGREMDAYKVDMVLGSPNVNIHRDPMNGRVFEGYSEDPCLAASLAPEFVKGLQAEGPIANVKHFAANNQETHRQNVDETIPLRALEEIYFPGFKACVQEGKVKSVMSAYNKINGTACAMNHWLLTDVLRGEWGFDGLVVSDWGAAYDQAKAIAAGNDLDMPGPRDIQPILDAVANGSLKMEEIDLAVSRMLQMLLDMPVMKGRKYDKIDPDYSKDVAYRCAEEGITLLKNDGLLPLKKDAKLSFFGNASKRFIESGGGSAKVHTKLTTSLMGTAKQIAGEDNVCFGEIKADTDVVVIAATAWGQEGWDRFEMDVAPSEKEMLMTAVRDAKAAGKRVVVVLNVVGPVDVSDYEADADAILCVFYPGMEGGRVAAQILFGEVNPSGKLPVTFPKRYKDAPTYGNFPGCAGEVFYGEGILVGYRYYDTKDVKPRYAFGHGLSYSKFEISDLTLDHTVVNYDNEETLTASVKVRNVSDRAGKEVVQIYISDVKSTLDKPVKELKAFHKVLLQPSEEQVLTFQITKDMLKSYDPEHKCWDCEAGYYEVLAGNASDNISCKAKFLVKCRSIYNYNEKTMLCVIHADERAAKIIDAQLEALHIDVSDMADALYYFPHREIGQVLHSMLDHAPIDEAVKKQAYEQIFEAVGALDISEL